MNRYKEAFYSVKDFLERAESRIFYTYTIALKVCGVLLRLPQLRQKAFQMEAARRQEALKKLRKLQLLKHERMMRKKLQEQQLVQDKRSR